MDIGQPFYKEWLSVDNVHNLTGISKSKLRSWEKSFKGYLNPQRTTGNQRRYAPTDLEKIKRIAYLLEQEKYTVAGARQRLGLEVKYDDMS